MDSSFEDIVNGSPAVLVDFYADWCAPCKLLIPILDDVMTHFAGKIKLHKVDIDQHADIARSFHILSVPTLILFRSGKEVWRIRGFDVAPSMIKSISEYL